LWNPLRLFIPLNNERLCTQHAAEGPTVKLPISSWRLFLAFLGLKLRASSPLPRKRRLFTEGLEERRVLATSITLSAVGSLSEDGDTIEVTVARTGTDTSPISVGLQYTGDVDSSDFVSFPASVSLTGSSATFTIAAFDDVYAEGDEDFSLEVNLSGLSNYSTNSLFLTIADNDGGSSGSGSGGGGSSGSGGGGGGEESGSGSGGGGGGEESGSGSGGGGGGQESGSGSGGGGGGEESGSGSGGGGGGGESGSGSGGGSGGGGEESGSGSGGGGGGEESGSGSGGGGGGEESGSGSGGGGGGEESGSGSGGGGGGEESGSGSGGGGGGEESGSGSGGGGGGEESGCGSGGGSGGEESGCGCGSESGSGSASGSGSPASVHEGETYTEATPAAEIRDKCGHLITTLQYWEYNWGDGSSDIYYPGDLSSHVYADDHTPGTSSDTYTVTARAYYWNGQTKSFSREVTVHNVAPSGSDDTAITNEDTLIHINVLANDSDVSHPDFHVLSVFSVSGGIGSVSVVDNVVRYDPRGRFDYLKEGEEATDSFTYQLIDDDNGQTEVAVTVTITGKRERYFAMITGGSSASEEGSAGSQSTSAGSFNVHLTLPTGQSIPAGQTIEIGYYLVSPDDDRLSDPDAASANDVVENSGTVAFTGESREASFSVTPIQDFQVEPDENIWFAIAPTENDDYEIVVDSAGIDSIKLRDDEWRWADETKHTKTSPSYQMTINDHVPGADKMPYSYQFDWRGGWIGFENHGEYKVYDGLIVEDSFSVNGLGAIAFNLDPSTGEISEDALARNGTNAVIENGPASMAISDKSITYDNDPSKRTHTVSVIFEVYVGAQGTWQIELSTGVYSFQKSQNYGMKALYQEAIVLVAKKGN
jgi:hypothetical protein